MNDIEGVFTMFSYLGTLAGSSLVTFLAQQYFLRKKAKAEVDGMSIKNQGEFIKNAAALDDHWLALLEKREGMAEAIYTKLISHEKTILKQNDLIHELQKENAKLKVINIKYESRTDTPTS
jgi:hypothetical protein